MQYHVVLDLNRDLQEYVPGSTIELDETVAAYLLEEGVISTDRVVPEAVTVEEPVAANEPVVDPQPFAGGEPASSGEPSIDVSASTASTVEATDITPVLEDMTRAELNAHAADKGVPADFIDKAPNKAAVIDLIKSTGTVPEQDPSANL